MNKNKNNDIKDEELDKVSGGGLFSTYTDATYNEAGVEIIGAGNFYNDGYKFKGINITTREAECIVELYFAKKRIADSVEEAVEYVEELEREKRDRYIPV